MAPEGHERRELAGQLATVRGATVVEVAPFNRLLVPLMWAQRRMIRPGDAVATTEQNLRTPPLLVNRSLQAALRGEQALAALLDPTPLPGASLWFAVRRQ
ncbi:MAG: hypothetical protein EOO75_05305 [Myxococcales bacterium]|nr:MAG: hypothetical protein EOO75_05305 [Myxococcales bacterium]